MTIDWNDVRFFLALQRAGSLAGAARHLGVDPTTVGRRLAALESALETTLFERTPAGLVPTPSGALLGPRAERAEGELLASERELRGRSARLEGEVVLTAGDGITAYLLVPWLLEFRRAYPGITLDLRSDNRALDMARREADLAVRLFRPREPSLVAVRAGTLPFSIYGSEPYFARRGRPRTVEELAAHDWVAWDARLEASPQSRWLARHVPTARVCLRANTTTSLVAACAAGHGLAVLPTFVAAGDARLVAMLSRSPPPSRDVWIVTHADARKNARVRALAAWLAARFGG